MSREKTDTIRIRTDAAALKNKTLRSLVACTLVLLTILSFFYATLATLQNTSLTAQIYVDLLDLFMSGDDYVSETDTLKKVEKRRKANKNYKVSAFYKSLFGFETYLDYGREVCVYEAKDSARAVVYFHGGSFMWQPLITHYAYCDYLRRELNVNVIMPIYPKAPEYGYADALAWVYEAYATINNNYDVVAFMGDSAGGGLMFSFAQYLADRGEEVPPDLIAFSPSLDLSLQNEEIAAYSALEPMLNVDDLRLKLSFYVPDGDFENPYASAIYCDFTQFEEVTLFVGTREILLPDIRKLVGILEKESVNYNYYEFENLFHTFSILPMPERGECLRGIKKALGYE